MQAAAVTPTAGVCPLGPRWVKIQMRELCGLWGSGVPAALAGSAFAPERRGDIVPFSL